MPAHASVLSWLVFSDSDIEVARRLIDDLDTSDATVDTVKSRESPSLRSVVSC